MHEPVAVQGAPAGVPDPVSVGEIAEGYGEDAAPDSLESAVAELDVQALEGLRLTELREAAEQALAEAQAAERAVLEGTIPELLERMRMKKCTTLSGVEVALKAEVKASLPGRERVADRDAAFAWLLEGGHGGVIENLVIIDLDRGEDERANKLAASLRQLGFDQVKTRKDVHPSTLSALVRELMEAGKVVPTDKLNVFDRKVAKLVRK